MIIKNSAIMQANVGKNKKIVADAISHLLNGNICFPFQITALFIKDNYLIWCVSTNKFGF